MLSEITDALQVLKDFQMPKAQLNERTALCLLALINLDQQMKWSQISRPLMGITPIMDYVKDKYDITYAPNTRETFRRFSMHQMVEVGLALYNPDNPNRPINSPKSVYQISEEAFNVLKIWNRKI